MISNTNYNSTSRIKPIETEYKGYRFRSRLEARWAVFFDTIDLKYEYETEGYDILGEWYLPDFWFPQLKIHCEIKPNSENIDHSLYKQFRDTISPILLVEGSPWDYNATWFGFDVTDSSGGSSEFNAAIGCPGGTFGHIILEDTGDREFLLTDWVAAPYTINCRKGMIADINRNKYFGCPYAILKAKRARFEHGESP